MFFCVLQGILYIAKERFWKKRSAAKYIKWVKSVENLNLEELGMEYGLSEEQAKERFAAGLDNCRVTASTKSAARIIRKNVFTYFNLIFLIFAVLLVLVGAWNDMLFLFVIVANTIIGIVQELHAKRVLERLSILNEPKVKVFRGKQLREVSAEELVQEDVILLTAGRQLPADAVVLEGTIQVNEALITGEADEVTKQKDDELFSGSFVVSGTCIAALTKVGKESYISGLTRKATQEKVGEQSKMMQSLNHLILFMGILILPIGIALFVQAYVYNQAGLRDSVTGMIAAVIGMIPEGLYLLASVAMAVSTVRLGRQQVLIHDMRCIEAFARVDVLCVDKTGTITETAMQVRELVVLADEADRTHIQQLLSDFVKSMSADNTTMRTLQEYFKEEKQESPAEQVLSFSPQYKYSGAVLDGQAYVLGAPECVLGEAVEEYQEKLSEYAMQGARVLVFAAYEGSLDGGALLQKVQPLVFALLGNQVREGAKDTFSYFRENQVAIKVISGDNPLTVSVIAQEAGIDGAEHYVDAATLDTDADFAEAIGKYTVFGRVTPEQKQKIVHALQKQGRTVAMTGDGVNDVLALRSADCSIAMASGSEAAASVAQLVLLDSDFKRMPSVVAEGRRVVNNIQRSASLYIVKNIFSILLALFSVALMWEYPLVPVQVSLISMFTIGIPSFCLAMEPNQEAICGHFLTNIFIQAIPAGITDFLVVGGLTLYYRVFGLDDNCLSTSCILLLAAVGILVLHRVAKPQNLFHAVLTGAMALGVLLSMLIGADFFYLHRLSKKGTLLLILFLLLIQPLLSGIDRAVRGIYCLALRLGGLLRAKILQTGVK